MPSRSSAQQTGLRSLLVLLAVSGAVAPSAAASGTAVWRDCAIGGIDQKHSLADYDAALANPPTDGLEYSDCLEQIQAARRRAAQQQRPAGPDVDNPTIVTPLKAVPSSDLASALGKQGLTALASAAGSAPSAGGDKAPAPAGITVDGKPVDLAAGTVPSLSAASTLPLPLALSAAALLLVAAGPVLRRLAALRAGRSSSPGSDR